MDWKRTIAVAGIAIVALAPSAGLSQPRAAPGVTYKLDPLATPQKRPDPHRFDARVEAYEATDKQAMPAPCGVVFIGSASIAAWKTLNADMAPNPVIGRGLGGSTVADEIFFFDRIVTPYRPRAIFVYAGENDVVNGVSPQEVLTDFKAFMALKTQKLGPTPVYYIPAKPSPARLASAKGEQEANDLIKGYAKERRDLLYIPADREPWEGGKLMGVLKPIYVADGIHMNAEGYASWTRIIKPYVDKESARANACPH